MTRRAIGSRSVQRTTDRASVVLLLVLLGSGLFAVDATWAGGPPENPWKTPATHRWGEMSWDLMTDIEALAYPQRAVVLLVVEWAEGEWSKSCTATLVGPAEVYTAAHCLYANSDSSTPPYKPSWLKILLDPSLEPYVASLMIQVEDYEIDPQFVNSPSGARRYDRASLRTDTPIGEQLGYFGAYQGSDQRGEPRPASRGTLETPGSGFDIGSRCTKQGLKHLDGGELPT